MFNSSKKSSINVEHLKCFLNGICFFFNSVRQKHCVRGFSTRQVFPIDINVGNKMTASE